MTPLRRDFLPAELKLELGQNEFQGCVAVQARQAADQEQDPASLDREDPEGGGVPQCFLQIVGPVTQADWNHRRPDDVAPYLDVAFEALGPERLMIGSDWPVCTVAASYGRAVGAVTHYVGHLSREAQEAVLGGNAQRFWRLKLPSERR